MENVCHSMASLVGFAHSPFKQKASIEKIITRSMKVDRYNYAPST